MEPVTNRSWGAYCTGLVSAAGRFPLRVNVELQTAPLVSLAAHLFAVVSLRSESACRPALKLAVAGVHISAVFSSSGVAGVVKGDRPLWSCDPVVASRLGNVQCHRFSAICSLVVPPRGLVPGWLQQNLSVRQEGLRWLT